MLLFVSELDRIKRILKDNFDIGIENATNKIVNQTLHQVGVYKICNVAKGDTDFDAFAASVRHWRYATGERVNEQTSKAFETIEGRLTPELAKGMWKSVSEAVVNSVEHAYVEARGVDGPRMGHSRWWMFSQEKDDKLTVAVCDLGIGIPRSLPLNWQASMLQKLRDTFSGEGSDSRSIRAALEVGATSTSASHRGKGLPQIWNTLRNVKGASISIMSNYGSLTWNGDDGEEFAHEHDTSIAGTLIIWTVASRSGAGLSNEG